MSNLLKFQNINMSDSPVVIKDSNNKISTQQNNAEVSENSCNICENTQEQLAKIEEIEKKAFQNAKNIEENAKKQAQKIIFEAESQADKLKIYNQRELNKQLEQIKKDEAEKARKEARDEIFERIGATAQYLENCLGELEKNQQKFFISLEKNIPQLALEIAGKILFKRVNETPEEMEMLIKNTISDIKGATWIDVKVGENLKDIAKQIMGDMSESLKDRGTTLDINASKENNWEVVAESDKGIIDSSINTQIKNFMDFIETYQKKQGE